jgi:hypothetical protein
MKYPKWKLEKMGEYSGQLDNHVFDYLNKLDSRQTETYENPFEDIGYQRQLPDHGNISKLEKECGTKLLAGLKKIMCDADCKNPKQAISELHAKLREEYPQFSHSLTL